MSGTNSGSTPFDWLSGGLGFFNKGGDENINSCKDVHVLLNGVQENLTTLLAEDPIDYEGDCSKYLQARLRRIRFLLYDERRQTAASGSSSNNNNNRQPMVATKTMESLTTVATEPDSDTISPTSLSLLMPRLISRLCDLPFESRKDVAAIFNYLLVCGLEGSDREQYNVTMVAFRDYTMSNFNEIFIPIMDGHECPPPGGGDRLKKQTSGEDGEDEVSATMTNPPDVVLHCGSMYRSCLRHEVLYETITGSTAHVKEFIFPFLDRFAHSPNFEVASDAMETLRLILTVEGATPAGDEEGHKRMSRLCADFLTRDYEAIFNERFNPELLSSSEASYIIRRMALQILSTVLLTRSNYAVMIKYIASKKNLIMVMLLLRDTSPHITLDAFHVFKIFVANPTKPPEIVKILTDNKVKLVKYLETLHKDKEESDKQFADEKALVIQTIDAL